MDSGKMFEGRSLSKVGVGETGKVNVVPVGGTDPSSLGPVTWECDPETCMTISGGTTLQTSFAAKDRACAATVCATIGTCRQCIQVSIVEPNGVRLIRNSDVRHERGTAEAGFIAKVFVLPDTVCFDAIKVIEGRVEAFQSGSFTDLVAFKIHDRWNNFAAIESESNRMEGYDHVYSGKMLGPWAKGEHIWHIPWIYKIGAGGEKPFATVTHHAEVDDFGTVKIKKGGASVTAKSTDRDSMWTPW